MLLLAQTYFLSQNRFSDFRGLRSKRSNSMTFQVSRNSSKSLSQYRFLDAPAYLRWVIAPQGRPLTSRAVDSPRSPPWPWRSSPIATAMNGPSTLTVPAAPSRHLDQEWWTKLNVLQLLEEPIVLAVHGNRWSLKYGSNTVWRNITEYPSYQA